MEKEARMKRQGKGIYFHPERREIRRVTDSDPNPGEGWIKISEDHTLGLLTATRKVGEQGLVDDPSTVYWFGMRGGSMEGPDAISELIGRFKRDSEESGKAARNKSGFLKRLAARLMSLVGGLGSDTGRASSLMPVPIPVSSRDAGPSRRSS